MPKYSREPETNPAVHLLVHHEYGRDEDDNPTKDPIVMTEEIARQRAVLVGDRDDPTPLIGVDHARGLILASVLQESAARLRLAAETGHPAGSFPLADFAEELAEDLLVRTGLKGS